ncbi:hypothetical protein FQN54_002400 [Arachnomyces sp. PD_36]|nr:hypothetical protein FQN54_002400 [Arachnomyces sp. PD_36]
MNSKLSQVVLFYAGLACLVGNASAEILYQDLHLVPKFAKAHGIVMGVAFVIILPLGAILVRLLKFKGAVWVHVACQLIGWVLMLAGLATGIKVGKILDRLHNNGHTILGTIVVVLLLLQPFIGFIHHRRFMATQKRTAWTHLHVWYGRVLIILGMINGGLGLKLAANSKAGNIAYGVVAGVIGVLYLASIGLFETKSSKAKRDGKMESSIAMEQSPAA